MSQAFFIPASIRPHIPGQEFSPRNEPPDLTCRVCSQEWWPHIKARMYKNGQHIPSMWLAYIDMILWEMIWEARQDARG